MKNNFIITCGVLIIYACMPSHVHAEASWLDKGFNIFKNLNDRNEGTISNEPSSLEIGQAFKEALRIGAEEVVNKVGRIDGFNNDPAIHIPLPKELDTIKTMLSTVGMSQQVEDLELKLNRAAESAVPKAKSLFWEAITEMTFDDVTNIYEGPEDSATNYFKSKMSSNLKKEMQPIVERTLSQVGAIRAYDIVMGQYKTLPFVPDVKANLEEHVIQKGMEGMFFYMAKEEASIRSDPTKQTTTLLKKVFGVK